MTTSENSPQQPFLRPFQQRVFDFIQQGRSVILQAPTGAGKTRAALTPFVANLAWQGNKLPLTCRYAVPMRVLANQFYREYHNLAARIDKEAPTRLEYMYRELGLPSVAIQTGEQPDDPQFESILTFCTIDQLLASFLAVPLVSVREKLTSMLGPLLALISFSTNFTFIPC